MIQAVIFDLGDTVLEEKSYDIASGFAEISRNLVPHATLEQLNLSIAKYQVGSSEFRLLKWIESNLSNLGQSTRAADLELELWRQTVSLLPKPGIRNVLDFLKGKNIRIAAISNAIFSSICMERELEMHGLDDYFEFIISSADIGIRKPDKAIFELALNKLDIEPNNTWYIGDNWDADIVGATFSRMTPVWFKKEFPNHDTNLKHIKLEEWSDFKNTWIQHAKPT